MGEPQLSAALNCGLLQEERRDALIEALPQNLLDEPHHIGKSGGHELVGIVCHRRGLLHQAPVDLRGNDPELRVLFRLDDHLKLNGAYHAGGGEKAHVPVKQPVEGDLPPLLRKNVGPQLPGFHQQQPRAVHIAIVHEGPLSHGPGHDRVQDPALLRGGKPAPHRKAARKIHRSLPPLRQYPYYLLYRGSLSKSTRREERERKGAPCPAAESSAAGQGAFLRAGSGLQRFPAAGDQRRAQGAGVAAHGI